MNVGDYAIFKIRSISTVGDISSYAVSEIAIFWSLCCTGIRGNVDSDAEDVIDITDLVYFVDYSFGDPAGPEPPCFDEADVDASGGIDITDLVYLVSYLFINGHEPVECPASKNNPIFINNNKLQ